jgi:hypothetical protein
MANQHRNSGKRGNWISASDVGRTDFCPNSVFLKYKGAAVSREARVARQRGDIAHDKLNQQAAQDKRCYVATYLYGMDDPRTHTLRSFRDQTLMRYPGGAWLVRSYYRLSPVVIDWSRRSPMFHRVIANLVTRVVILCAKKEKEQG